MATDWGAIRNKISIEGDAAYKKSINEINRVLREAKSEMKAVSAEYEANSDSAEALQANIAALESVQEGQNLALETMRKHLEQVTEQYGENSREAVELRTKINNARAEMAKTSTQLNDLRNRLDATGDATEDMTQTMGGATDGLAGVGAEAERAQGEVEALSQSIADMMGEKLISIGIGKEALSKLGSAISDTVSDAIGHAIADEAEDAMARALAGDDELAQKRVDIKDAIERDWAAYVDGSTATSTVATVDTVLGNKGITDSEHIRDITNMALTQNVVFGQNVQDVMNRATSMVNTFGISYEEAIDLMTKGMRDMSDGGEQMLSAFETYPQLFQQIGYDADDMYSAIATASNDVNLGRDTNFIKGVRTFVETITSGSDDCKEALSELGFEVTDLPLKFQEGGEAAALATQDILYALMSIEDEAKRNDLGKTLFGDTIWTDSNGGIVDVILSGYDQIVDASGATQDAMDAVLDTWEAQSARAGERISQTLDDVTEPFVNIGTAAAKAFVDGYDEGGILNGLTSVAGAGLEAVGTAILGAGSDMASMAEILGTTFVQSLFGQKTQEEIEAGIADLQRQIDEAFASGDIVAAAQLQENMEILYGSYLGMGQEAAAAYSEGISEGIADIDSISEQISEKFYSGVEEGAADTSAADTTAQRWVDVLLGSVDAAAAESEQSDAIKDMLDGLLPDTAALQEPLKTYAESHKAAVIAQMEEVYGQEDDEDFEAWKTFQQNMIDSSYDDTVERAGQLGEDAAQADVGAIEDAEPDAERAGEDLGLAGVDGLQYGCLGMYGAGKDGADGAVSGLGTGISEAYDVGYATGQAYERGYRNALKTHSPSRVMYDAAQDTTEGLFERFDEDEDRLRQAAAGLGEAVLQGYAGVSLDARDGMSGMASGLSIDYDSLGQAVAGAIARAGIGFYVDGERVADVCEPAFSRATARRALGTVKGQGASSRSW